MSYNYGDVIVPYIENYEPMKAECENFLKCINGKQATPVADGRLGTGVVKTLDALRRSLKGDGKWIKI